MTDYFPMIDWLQGHVSTLGTMDRRTVVSLLIPLVPLGLYMARLYTMPQARRLPPGSSSLRFFLEVFVSNENMWSKVLKFNQQYGVLNRDYEIRCHSLFVGQATLLLGRCLGTIASSLAPQTLPQICSRSVASITLIVLGRLCAVNCQDGARLCCFVITMNGFVLIEGGLHKRSGVMPL